MKAEAALGQYWKQEPSLPVKIEMMRDWQEGLEDFHEEEIRAAFREHLANNTKIRPNVAFIRKILFDNRRREMPEPVRVEKERRPKITPEEMSARRGYADKMLQEAGFRLRVKLAHEGEVA